VAMWIEYTKNDYPVCIFYKKIEIYKVYMQKTKSKGREKCCNRCNTSFFVVVRYSGMSV